MEAHATVVLWHQNNLDEEMPGHKASWRSAFQPSACALQHHLWQWHQVIESNPCLLQRQGEGEIVLSQVAAPSTLRTYSENELIFRKMQKLKQFVLIYPNQSNDFELCITFFPWCLNLWSPWTALELRLLQLQCLANLLPCKQSTPPPPLRGWDKCGENMVLSRRHLH